MSLKHPEINLIPYLRGELSGREHDRMAAHLDGCAECRAQADELARTLKLVAHQVEQLPAPDWAVYRAELRRKLAAREAREARWWQSIYVWGGMATAGVAAVALLTVVAINRGNEGQPGVDQIALADVPDLGLMRNYPMVERLDMLNDDNYEVIAHLDELTPPSSTNELRHS
jgi:anti-sigma factor RsiW